MITYSHSLVVKSEPFADKFAEPTITESPRTQTFACIPSEVLTLVPSLRNLAIGLGLHALPSSRRLL